MKYLLIIVFSVLCLQICTAQRYYTKEGTVSFHSKAPLEDIEATNTKAYSVFDTKTGALQWGVLIKAFQFEKALMQEHFNENYMESSTYPKATFKGKIDNIDELDLSTDGTFTAKISGDLTIHGQKNAIDTTALFTVLNDKISATSNIKLLIADYGIEVPAVVRDNIAKEVEITINTNYLKFNN